MTFMLHDIKWQPGIIPPDCKRGLVIQFWTGKVDHQHCNSYFVITLLSVPSTPCLSAAYADLLPTAAVAET